MASWPAADRGTGPPPLSPQVRRRVDRAMRLDIRRSVRVGAPLVAVGVGADAIHLLLRFGSRGTGPAAVDGLAIAATLVVAFIGLHMRARLEVPALVILLALQGTTITNLWLLSPAASTETAYLAMVLVGSALFLSWSPTWHGAWVLAAVTAAVLPLLLGAPAGVAVPALVASVIGGLVSLVGHRVSSARARHMLEHQFTLRMLTRRTYEQERALAQLNADLVRTARVDTVTGIGNRRALDEALESLTGRRLAAVLLDVDHFKAFNDRNGHLAGDAALARVGEILRSVVRHGDLVFRYGGEEFLVLLPEGTPELAAALAERVRAAIEEGTAADLGLTVSAGVASADRFSSSSPLPLLRRADAALYRAKRAGRNRVVGDDLAAAPISLAG